MEHRNKAGTEGPTFASELGPRIAAVAQLYEGRKSAADAGGFSIDQLARYMRGENEPSFSRLARMALAKGVRLEWLATGEGPMYAEELPPALIDKDLLRAIVHNMTVMIREEELNPTDEQIAKFISDLYEYIIEEEIEDEASRKRAIRLVISNVA
jgi:transcriptional regulator with XRE-family HTH domain